MRSRRRLTPLATLALIAMVALVASCSDKATNPTGGGGGGGTKELNSGDILNGQSFVHTFANAGTYNYHCVHHTMSGSVIVHDGQPMSATVTIGASSYSPTPAHVAPGGTVTWNNNGPTHTVTSD
jgi:plastocyanin